MTTQSTRKIQLIKASQDKIMKFWLKSRRLILEDERVLNVESFGGWQKPSGNHTIYKEALYYNEF